MHIEKMIIGAFLLSLLIALPVTAKLQANPKSLVIMHSESATVRAVVDSKEKVAAASKPKDPPPVIIEEPVAVPAQAPPQQQAVPETPVVSISDPASIIMNTLKSIGVTHRASAYLTGSFEHESGFDPDQKRGDGGKAWGLNSWWPGRRQDMPNGLAEQTRWAIEVEMARDTPHAVGVMKNPHATDEEIKSAIYRWTRWGVLGNRWVYAQKYL